MKKLFTIVLTVLLIYALTGCVVTQEPVFIPGEMTLRNDLDVIDLSDSYTFDERSMKSYTYENDPVFNYVNIEEFVSFFEDGFINYEVSKEDVLQLRYVHYIETDLRDVVGYSYKEFFIRFNGDSNEVYFSDFDIITRLNFGFSVSTNDVVELVSVTEEDESSEITIDLDDYGFDIVFENDQYYIPLYLANLFLTGSSINIYEQDTSLIIFDYASDIDTVINEYQPSTKTFFDTQETTTSYLNLYYDYFYGLKEYKEIESFVTYMEEYNLNENLDYQSYFDDYNQFVVSLDDLHTQVIDYGYLAGSIETNADYDIDSKLGKYSITARQNECLTLDETFYYDYVDGAHYFTITEFRSNTGELFYNHAQYINEGEEVIIDIACNTGGSIQGVVETLVYLTDQSIPIRHINSRTQRVTEEMYKSVDDITINGEFTLITSNVSYSAANVFASIFQDLDLGLVLGDETLGGACALVYTVLPNGTIISNSSYVTFVNKDLEIKEDGIEHDIDYYFPINPSELVNDLDSYFELGSYYSFSNRLTSNRARIDFDLFSKDEDIIIEEYIVEIYDENELLIHTESFDGSFFTIHYFDSVQSSYRVTVKVVYSYDSITYEEVILEQDYI